MKKPKKQTIKNPKTHPEFRMNQITKNPKNRFQTDSKTPRRSDHQEPSEVSSAERKHPRTPSLVTIELETDLDSRTTQKQTKEPEMAHPQFSRRRPAKRAFALPRKDQQISRTDLTGLWFQGHTQIGFEGGSPYISLGCGGPGRSP